MSKVISIHKHILVPKHVLLSKEEAQALLATYNIVPSQLPAISIKDPVLKDLHPEVGDIVKVIRDSPTEIEALFYRLVKAD